MFSRKVLHKERNMEHDFNPYETESFRPRPRKPINYFETAAWICAGGALFCSLFFYVSYVLGALAIVFALLSRGGQMQFSKKAKMALIVGIFAILLSTVLTIAAVYITIEEFGSLENVLREYCMMYGLDFEELYGDMFLQ